MSKGGPYKIGELEFKDITVKVYNDNYTESPICIWQMRNPDSCYTGLMYMNNDTGKISYPEHSVIPEQTSHDREILPKFVITGEKELTNKVKVEILEYLEKDY
jgi:hypothetical protein|tara:strand:+ start:395 stop:703 length:309 start_codon:yes stop_codon:yes gene_type:complete